MSVDGDDLLRVSVAVLTYRRPADLAHALPALVGQVASLTEAEAELIVIDNDPDASARSSVTALSSRCARVRYVHEPRPGIAAGRNRALVEAADADAIVYIDDDERPSPRWLLDLVRVWREYGPTAVVGPVVSEFAAPPAPFVAAGQFFDRRRLVTGSEVSVAATNNLLLDVARLQEAGVTFDEEFGLSGGSDTLFTRQLARAGHRLVWCDEAWVVDVVPPERLTAGWVLRRAFRSGNSWARTSLALADGPVGRTVVRGRLLGPGALRAFGGAALACAGALTASRRRQARGARTLARGAGMTTGAFGYVYSEYARKPGS